MGTVIGPEGRQAIEEHARERFSFLTAAVPPELAAQLARLALPDEEAPESRPLRWRATATPWDDDDGQSLLDVLSLLPSDLLQQLIASLEPLHDTLGRVGDAPLVAPPALPDRYFVMTSDRDGPLLRAARGLVAAHPWVATVVRQAARPIPTEQPHPDGAAGGGGDPGDVTRLLARHALVRLAPALVAAIAVVRGIDAGVTGDDAAAGAIGLAVSATALALLRDPVPPGYRAAALSAARAGYTRPSGPVRLQVRVTDHQFVLGEHPVPDGPVDLSATGLAATVRGGVLVRTGTRDGQVSVTVTVAEGPPDAEEEDLSVGEDVVVVSYRAESGFASLHGADVPPDGTVVQGLTPPRAGDWRVRVESWGRDTAEAGGQEAYAVRVWPAPPAPPTVHRALERTGCRLRGEPEASWPERPELAYSWIEPGYLGVAATVTVVTGSPTRSVLAAFGADLRRPTPWPSILGAPDPDTWVGVVELDAAVALIEANGYRGTEPAVLAAASRGGRAASMYWNVNGVTQLSLADGGEVLASFEPGWHDDDPLPAPVAEALAGLDFGHGNPITRGLVAVERFTGHRLTADAVEALDEDGIAYPLGPVPAT